MSGWRTILLGMMSLALAGTAGALGAYKLGSNSQQAERTVTINVGTGEQGPPGPEGPSGPIGPPGTLACPTKFSPGDLVINHPGGQTTIFTCIHD